MSNNTLKVINKMDLQDLQAENQRLRCQVALLQSDWVSEREAAELLGIKVRTIRQYRYSGTLKKWRSRPTGRGFQYSLKEINSLFNKAA